MADNSSDITNTTTIPAGFQHVTEPQNGVGEGPKVIRVTPGLEIICGPLLNYRGMSSPGDQTSWHGTILLVTKPGQKQPRLQIKSLGPVASLNGGGDYGASTGNSTETIEGLKLYEDTTKAFWRFSVRVPLGATETRWQYTIPDMHFLSEVTLNNPTRTFVVPSKSESMRIMFHSCNGFSVGTDLDTWTGPVLWSDVLRVHDKKPFHVMVGGGDQIYNDNVRVSGPLKEWTAIANPHKRRKYPFGETLRQECDDHYFKNYIEWYGTEPFRTANAQIPQVNIWDDHDIIDGFGSYTDHFMQCPVFRGIGAVAFKYYCLFQHHVAPPKSTFTTDAKQTIHARADGSTAVDPKQLQETYIYGETADDPSWIVGSSPGPYVEEHSRSLYMRLGKRIALLGIDGRTERTRHQVNYPDTYDKIFSRLESEVVAAHGDIKHLILLLGIPIAYPRLAWLENVLSSPMIAPIRLLNKRFGWAGGFFNSFDGSVDLLDDLDDHYTARTHKKERNELVQRLQQFAHKHSVRVTILGGDVHLAAIGRFYSKPGLKISAENDHRYMANIVSSAITNKPPPKAVANLLARRNKIHHLDHETDETLLKIFDVQPGGVLKSADFNKVTMPSRNYATITEVTGSEPNGNGAVNGGVHDISPYSAKDGHEPLHTGEDGAGTTHPASDGISATSGMVGGLDVSIQVEIDSHDREGKTQGYGFSIPPLHVSGSKNGLAA